MRGASAAVALQAVALSTILAHLVDGIDRPPVAHGGLDGQHAVEWMLPQAAAGYSVWKIKINFFAKAARLIGCHSEFGQLLQGRGSWSCRQKSDVKPFGIDSRLAQERIICDRVFDLVGGSRDDGCRKSRSLSG
jgi:hypothetical protein